ncbi:hypothetical protein KI387_039174, partial [Taxus chinensis]
SIDSVGDDGKVGDDGLVGATSSSSRIQLTGGVSCVGVSGKTETTAIIMFT